MKRTKEIDPARCLRSIIVPIENVKDGVNAVYAVIAAMENRAYSTEEFIPALRFAVQNMETDIQYAAQMVNEHMPPED